MPERCFISKRRKNMCGGCAAGVFAYAVHLIQVCFCYECVRLLSVTGVSVAFLTYFGSMGVFSAAWTHIQQQVFGAEIQHLWALCGTITSTP